MPNKNTHKKMLMIPGCFFGGGCCYMACRGLVLSPMSDVLVITHGASGCAVFSSGAGFHGERRSSPNPRSSFGKHSFSTGMTETDIIYGGEEKLFQAIKEAVRLFHPQTIAVCSTCPIGLIGDKIDKIAERASAELGIRVLPLSCEGFRNIPGYKIADNYFISNVMKFKKLPEKVFPVNIIGEFYTGVNKQEFDAILNEIGYYVVSAMMGSTTIADLERFPGAALTVYASDKNVDDIVAKTEKKFGIRWIRADFTGVSNITAALRAMACYFKDEGLIQRTERVISRNLDEISEKLNCRKKHFEELSAAVFEDCFKSDHFIAMLSDLDIPVIHISEIYSALPVTSDDITHEQFKISVPSVLLNTEVNSFASQYFSGDERDGVKTAFLNRKEIKQILEALTPSVCFSGITEQFGYTLPSINNPDASVEVCCSLKEQSFFKESQSGFNTLLLRPKGRGIKPSARIKSRLFNSDDRGVAYVGFKGFLRFVRDLDMSLFISRWEKEPAWITEDCDGSR